MSKSNIRYAGGGGARLVSISGISCGFTLAEILITLGIIGVVAALTLPNLLANYRKNVVETHLKRVATTLNEAMKFAQIDYGSSDNWGTMKSQDFIRTYLIPYIPGSTFISESDLSYRRIYAYDKKSSMTLNGDYSKGIKLKTGEIITIGNGSTNLDPNRVEFAGYSFGVLLKETKYKNYISGKDYFRLYFDRERGNIDNVHTWGEHWGSDCEDSRLYNKCITEAGGAWCTMVIQCNGWKIPDDYPIRF